jgi:hypothetical protein
MSSIFVDPEELLAIASARTRAASARFNQLVGEPTNGTASQLTEEEEALYLSADAEMIRRIARIWRQRPNVGGAGAEIICPSGKRCRFDAQTGKLEWLSPVAPTQTLQDLRRSASKPDRSTSSNRGGFEKRPRKRSDQS